MKRSCAVQLVLLASTAAALEGCGRKQCVDERDIVVEDTYCRPPYPGSGMHGYRYYNGGFFNSTPVGGRVNASSSTVRGVFGSAGESAHGGGAGE